MEGITMNNKYVLGLDIGITSIGWSIIDEIRGKLLVWEFICLNKQLLRKKLD